jgi:hypothetical protein
MQEPTHILTGVIIQRSLQWIKPRPLALIVTAVTAFLSHGLLDRLADVTYHPADANFKSPFWVCFHACVLLSSLWFLYLWWRPYKCGIFFAMLPDLDWVFLHGQRILNIKHPFYRKPYMHNFLHIIFNQTPPFSHWKVPNNRHNPWASLFEVALILGMLVLIRFLTREDRMEAKPKVQHG